MVSVAEVDSDELATTSADDSANALEVEADIEVEADGGTVVSLVVGMAAFATCAEAAAATCVVEEALPTPAEAGDQKTAGVYTGIGSVVPYPATPQAGLLGAVYPAGGLVVVTVVVKVASEEPVDVPAQYPVPYTFLH